VTKIDFPGSINVLSVIGQDQTIFL